MERLQKLQYKAVSKITGRYHGSRQDLIENVAKREQVHIEVWDMKVRAVARILEKGVQNNQIHKAEETRESIGGRSWKDHGLPSAAVKGSYYNTSLEEILASMRENGKER